MLKEIQAFQVPKSASDIEEVMNRYDNGIFFTTGPCTKDEALDATHRITEAFEANPYRPTGPMAVQTALLDKIPLGSDDIKCAPLRTMVSIGRHLVLTMMVCRLQHRMHIFLRNCLLVN